MSISVLIVSLAYIFNFILSRFTDKKVEKIVLEKLSEVLKELELTLRDAEKFDGGNTSAGARVRKQSQVAVKALKDVRKTVQEVKVQRKVDGKTATSAP